MNLQLPRVEGGHTLKCAQHKQKNDCNAKLIQKPFEADKNASKFHYNNESRADHCPAGTDCSPRRGRAGAEPGGELCGTLLLLPVSHHGCHRVSHLKGTRDWET